MLIATGPSFLGLSVDRASRYKSLPTDILHITYTICIHILICERKIASQVHTILPIENHNYKVFIDSP